MTAVHVGCGAGFAGDRFDAALPVIDALAAREGPRYLIYEVLGERTLALAQLSRRGKGEAGASPYLEAYLRRALPRAVKAGVRIVTNMGAANPKAAARQVACLAREAGLSIKVAALSGDDLLATMPSDEIAALPTIEGIAVERRGIVAANAYLGARAVTEALATGADVVLVGRTTDSALVLGPLIHEHGWAADDWDRLAAGTIAGHLLECGGQVTGAYFADPGFKDVPDLAGVGFPVAAIDADGTIEIGKPDGTGGRVDRATVTEQLLYEMHDPAAYLVPDCEADVTGVEIAQVGPDLVRLTGVRGRPGPSTLKATVCFEDGWMAEAELTYAGPNAPARAALAAEVVERRLDGVNLPKRIELLGTGAVLRGGHRADPPRDLDPMAETRLRVAAKAPDRERAQGIADEVLSLYCSGPAGGGGYRCHVTPQLATASVLVPRRRIERKVKVEVLTC